MLTGNSSHFFNKTCYDPHLNRLGETVLMRIKAYVLLQENSDLSSDNLLIGSSGESSA